MRPKFLVLLAVPVLALVGCSAAEPAPATTPAPTVAETLDSTPSASATIPEDLASEVAEEKERAEEAYLVEYKQVAGNLEIYSQEELVEIGYDACDLMADGKKVPHNFTGETQGDHSVGIPAGMAAKVTLCPEVTE